MIKNTKKLVWAMAVLLLLVCACASISAEETPSGAVSKTANCGLDLAIVAPSDDNLRPGDVLELSANKISTDLEYTWSIVPDQFMDKFSEQKANKISFKVPEYDGVLKITLRVEVRESCEETVDHEIEVNVPLNTRVVEEIAAVETEVTNTPTATAVPSLTPESTVPPTAIPSPRPEPTATQSPTNVPPVTSTPMPTLNVPVITSLEFVPGGAISIAWAWDGKLSPTQNFAVRFWSENDPRPEARYSITWTKGFSYQFSIDSAQFPIGTYKINVAVMEGTSEGEHHEVVRSEDHSLFVDPPPPPPSPCPPSCP